jgi:hypothetical protein
MRTDQVHKQAVYQLHDVGHFGRQPETVAVACTGRLTPQEAPWLRFTGTATVTVDVDALPVNQGAPRNDTVMLNINCPALENYPNGHFWLAVGTAGYDTQRRYYETDRRSHSVLIPTEALRGSGAITIAVEAGTAVEVDADDLQFNLSVFVLNRRTIMAKLAARLIFVFSTARSGSTWIAADVLGWGSRNRPVDEPGLGLIAAPMLWEAERTYDIAGLDYYLPSGLQFEAGERESGLPETRLPPFERANAHINGPSWFFHPAFRDSFIRRMRAMVLEHVIEEWGLMFYECAVIKAPNESQGADFLLRALPEARAIHLIRDGRDVMSSRFGTFGSGILSTTEDPALRRHAIAYYSHYWNFQNDIIAEACAAHDPARVRRLRYEDVRADPAGELGALYAWIDQPLAPEQLAELVHAVDFSNVPRDQVGFGKRRGDGTIGRYRKMFTEDEITLMNSIMGQVLERWGYELD